LLYALILRTTESGDCRVAHPSRLCFMAAGAPIGTTETNAVDVPGAALFAPLFHAKGAGLDATRSNTAAKYHSMRFGSSILAVPLFLATLATVSSFRLLVRLCSSTNRVVRTGFRIAQVSVSRISGRRILQLFKRGALCPAEESVWQRQNLYFSG
jgi:hypothetical protein